MIIAGTGHRPDKLGGYSENAHNNLVRLAEHWIARNKPRGVISGMALGWDQALAEASIHAHVPLLAAVPFKGQEMMWPEASRLRYNQIMSMASKIEIVSEGGYAAYKMQIRNEWMVNNSDLLLALWNGSRGGTANCLKYAKSKNREIYNLWNEFSGALI
jgi:uncharacterized phage-like protein YoqJ